MASEGNNRCSSKLSTRLVKAFVLFVGLPCLLLACVEVRLLTYPERFVWLDQKKVSGVMDAMEGSMDRLDKLVGEQPVSAERQSAVLDELERLDQLAASMMSRGDTTRNPDEKLPLTNHLLIDEHLDEFVAAVQRATRLASNDPPSFYGVGQLTGECNACHRNR